MFLPKGRSVSGLQVTLPGRRGRLFLRVLPGLFQAAVQSLTPFRLRVDVHSSPRAPGEVGGIW